MPPGSGISRREFLAAAAVSSAAGDRAQTSAQAHAMSSASLLENDWL